MGSGIVLFAAVVAGAGVGAAIGISAGKVASQAINSRVAAVAAVLLATAFIYGFLGPVPVVVAALAVEVVLGGGAPRARGASPSSPGFRAGCSARS